MRSKRGAPINGWVNLNKPLGITSADAVNKVKHLLKPQKIGHAGTLDPLATGVLPLALGEGTKCVNLLMDAKKTYEFAVTFGESRTTDDAEGEVAATSDHIPTIEQIQAVLPQFTGEILQLPPIFSALKVAGRRAYDMARAGEEVVLQPRPITIYALELLGFTNLNSPLEGESNRSCDSVGGMALTHGEPPPRSLRSPLPLEGGAKNTAHFRATVSKGTYIRSLGRDIARAAGSEGYISRLHRAAVGPFTDRDAISLDFLAESVHKAALSGDTVIPGLTPLHAALDDIPALALSDGQWNQLRHGQRATLTTPSPDMPQIAVTHAGELVGLARVEGNQVISTRLLTT